MRWRGDYGDLRRDTIRETPKIAAEGGRRAGKAFKDSAAPHISGLHKMIASVFAAGIAIKGAQQVVGFLKSATSMASDLNETANKSNVIFGKNAGAVNAWAKNAANAFGLSSQSALDAASSFGNMFLQLGIGQKTAVKMSTGVVKLAADLGSFNNLPTADVLDRIQAALRGEYDSLQKVIPNINAARVEQEALNATHKKNVKDLTAADKATAVYAIVARDGARAAGDFAKTSGGLANQQKILSAQFGNLKAAIGTALLPVVVSFVKVLTGQVLPALQALWAKHGPAVTAFLLKVAVAFGQWAEKMKGVNLDVVLAKARPILAQLGPLVENLRRSVAGLAPELSKVGNDSGPKFADTLKVVNTVSGFLADHIDLLKKLLPALAIGFIAVKVAQLGANAAAAASPAIRIAEVIATRSLAKANLQLVASMRAQNASQVANAVATTGATTAMLGQDAATKRSMLSMIAHRVASVAARAATLAWTGVQWLLNAALTANPIGIVIVAVAALVAGIILLWKHNETFRKIVLAVWGAIKVAIGAVADWFMHTIWPSLQDAWRQAGILVQWLGKMVGIWWGFIQAEIKVAWAIIKIIWKGMQLEIKALGAMFGWLVAGVKIWWRGIQLEIKAAVAVVKFIWAGLKADIHLLGVAFGWLVAGVKLWWKDIQRTIDNVSNVIHTIWGRLKAGITAVATAFKNGVEQAKRAWSLLQDAAKKPVLFVVKVINTLSKGFNTIASKIPGFNVRLPLLSESFDQGGPIPGPIGPGGDDTVISAKRGEYVMPVGPSQRYRNTLDAMRRGMPSYEEGGIVGKIMNIARSFLPGARLSSGTRRGDSGYHGSGNAADIIGGGRSGMATIAKGFYNMSSRMLELIHEPMWYVKNGQKVGAAFYASVIGHGPGAEHASHVHTAMNEAGLRGIKIGSDGGIFADAVAYVAKNLTAPLRKLIGKALGNKALAGNGVGALARGAAGSLLNGAINAATSWATRADASNLPGGIASGIAGALRSGSVMAWINAAIRATGVPAWWASGLYTLVQRESGGNPRSINLTDSNARRGTPSKGIAQTIQSTFDFFRLRSLPNDIWNPVSNIAAAIRYIQARYGSINNVQQADASKPPRGYLHGGPVGDRGGFLVPGWNAPIFNGTGGLERFGNGGGVSIAPGALTLNLTVQGDVTDRTVAAIRAEVDEAFGEFLQGIVAGVK